MWQAMGDTQVPHAAFVTPVESHVETYLAHDDHMSPVQRHVALAVGTWSWLACGGHVGTHAAGTCGGPSQGGACLWKAVSGNTQSSQMLATTHLCEDTWVSMVCDQCLPMCPDIETRETTLQQRTKNFETNGTTASVSVCYVTRQSMMQRMAV